MSDSGRLPKYHECYEPTRSKLEARVAELEAENTRLRECADAMADAIEKHFKPEDQVILYRATFPREEAKS